MLSQDIRRIIEENRTYTDMLDYYERTGRLPAKKTLRSFTIEQINYDRLKAESARTGRNMSRLLDELIEKGIK